MALSTLNAAGSIRLRLLAWRNAPCRLRGWGRERIQWGAPIGQHAAIAEKIRRIAAHAFAMEAMLITTSCVVDRDKRADIRLEASICKLWGTEKAWMCLDEIMQVRGGRGYENVQSLKARGEKPYPVERMMRDSRVAMIFEGSSEIMRLFIMREALDPHLKIAGVALNSQRPVGERLRSALKAAGFYAWWYPRLWLPFGGGHRRHASSPGFPLERRGGLGRKLARNLFTNAQVRHPAEKHRCCSAGLPTLGRLVCDRGDMHLCPEAARRREVPENLYAGR